MEPVFLERRAVAGLVVGVVDGDHHVDDPLGAEAGDGGRAEVLDPVGLGLQGVLQRGMGLFVAGGPGRVIVLDDDGLLLRATDEHRVVH